MRHGSMLATACLLASLAIPARAVAGEPTVPDCPQGERVNPLVLLVRPDVGSELKLSPERAEAARRLLGQLHDKAAALKGRRDAQALAARRQVDEEMQRWLARELSPEQRSRLYQIELQWEGPAALHTRPTVAQGLGLTDEQRQGIAQAVALRNSLREQGRCQPADQQRMATQILAVLTAEQQRRWQALLGPALAAPATAAAEPAPKR